MSVLVQSVVPATSSSSSSTTTTTNNHYFSTRSTHGNLSQAKKHLSVSNRSISASNDMSNEDAANDHVPIGVVNSMKQRLLDKVNESLLLNPISTLVRHPLSKSSTGLASNENLLQIKSPSLKRTTRLSRSQDNLSNSNGDSVSPYLQAKQNVIIVDRQSTENDDDRASAHRHSYTEFHIDEVPKPGTVTTVKNMFERQIRLSRYDADKLSHTSAGPPARLYHSHRDLLAPTRSRSVSPYDMAIRQRRTTLPASVLPSASVSGPSSFPDLVISHTPSISSPMDINHTSLEPPLSGTNKENQLTIAIDEHPMGHTVEHDPSSETVQYRPLDFKSRLALFNRTNSTGRLNEQCHPSPTTKKASSPGPSASFLTKPVVHRHSEPKHTAVEIISSPTNRAPVNVSNSVTFYGGTKISDPSKTIPSTTPIVSPPSPTMTDESIDSFGVPDVIGGNVKLSKSSLFSGVRKDIRVQFIDDVGTFEYPSFDVAMAEFDSPDSIGDDDDRNSNNSTDDRIDDDELDRLAQANAKLNASNLSEKPLESKGSLHTFRPTYLDQYELGAQHAPSAYSRLSDTSPLFSREPPPTFSSSVSNRSIPKQVKSSFDMSHHIHWSSMSTNTDLLF